MNIESVKYPIIYCFDPGESTGLVVFNRKKKEIISHEILRGFSEIARILERINKVNEMVIFEKSHGTLTVASQFTMCMLTGFIKGYCEAYNIECVGQSPGVRTGFLKRSGFEMLKKFPDRKYMKHNEDALAHILKFINDNEGIGEIR